MAKVKTKEKILNKALELFNGQGVMNISQRDIANALGISQGNLTYHFEKRDDIIMALYNDLVKQNEMDFDRKIDASITDLYAYAKQMMTNYYKYRFIFINLVDIFKHYPKIKKHFVEITEEREKTLYEWMEALIKNNVVSKEKFHLVKDTFFTDLQIFIISWVSHAVCFQDKVNEKQIKAYYKVLVDQKIKPYLV